MTELHLRNFDHFWMSIDLDYLQELPLEKWRKICKKILPLEVNEAAVLRLQSWFPVAVVRAEDDYAQAAKRETLLWMDPAGRDKAGRSIAQEHNRELSEETSRARTIYRKLLARYEVFKSINYFKED